MPLGLWCRHVGLLSQQMKRKEKEKEKVFLGTGYNRPPGGGEGITSTRVETIKI